MHSLVPQHVELKLGMMAGDRWPRGMINFSKRPHQRSSRGQVALWLPNLVGRTPDQGVCRGQIAQKCPAATNFFRKNPCMTRVKCIAGVKGHAPGISQGQQEVKLLINDL